jgi:hypothetical protein
MSASKTTKTSVKRELAELRRIARYIDACIERGDWQAAYHGAQDLGCQAVEVETLVQNHSDVQTSGW